MSTREALCKELKEIYEVMCNERVWNRIIEEYIKLPDNPITIAYGVVLAVKTLDTYFKCKAIEAICYTKTNEEDTTQQKTQ